MSAIFSVQNLQTFLRRKNLRPPSRGGPPGPERPPPPPPPNRGRSPPPERSPKGREGRSVAAGALVSSGITLLLQSVAALMASQIVRPAEPRNCPPGIGPLFPKLWPPVHRPPAVPQPRQALLPPRPQAARWPSCGSREEP